MRYSIITCLFFCAVLTGCSSDDSNNNEALLKLIEKSQSNWAASGITSYTSIYTSTPTDCPTASPIPPVEITVENGTITQLYIPEFDVHLDVNSGNYLTIDGIFANMVQNIDDIVGNPSFDTSLGYPIAYETNVSDAECDGHRVSISQFI